MDPSNPCLDSITRCFDDYLGCFLTDSFGSPLRRIKAPKDPQHRRTWHQCPGYLREEITLTPDVSRSAIISHEYPSQSELCSVCGQLVRYEQSSSTTAVYPPSPLEDLQNEERGSITDPSCNDVRAERKTRFSDRHQSSPANILLPTQEQDISKFGISTHVLHFS